MPSEDPRSRIPPRRGRNDREGARVGRFRAFAVDLTPVRSSAAYRSLLGGQIVSLIGTQMRYVAVAWQVYSITGSSLAVGLLGLAELLPLLILSVFAGVLADARDRKRIMMVSQCASLLVALALLGVSLFDRPSLWALYALTVAGASFDALDKPARTAIIPSLVGPENIAAAFALRQLTFQISQVVGPAIGGLLIGSFSLSTVYAVDAATFVLSIASLRALAYAGSSGSGAKTTELIAEGWRFSMGRPLIRSVFAIDLIAMVFGMPRAVFPALAQNTFGIGVTGLGFLYAAPAVGALLGALWSGWVTRVTRFGRAIFLAVVVWGVAIALSGLVLFSLVATLVLLAIAGAADVTSAVLRGTLVQEATPDPLRGRVTAINTLVVAGGPRLGDLEAGLAASILGPAGSVVFGGLACLAGTGVLAVRAKELRAYVRRRPEDVGQKEGE